MIIFLKTIAKSNKFLLLISEKILSFLSVNFEKEYILAQNYTNPKIIDVGGHCGESIKGFLKFNKNSKIYSFEPNKKLFLKIKKKFKQNKNIKVFNYAISENKIYKLYIPQVFGIDLTLWSSFSKEYLRDRWTNFTSINFNFLKVNEISVKSKKLDFFKINPDIIKIDAEGAEFEIIKSCKKILSKNKPLLIIEFHSQNFSKIKKLLSNYKYTPYLFNFREKKLKSITNYNLKKIKSRSTSTNIVFK